MENTQSNGKCNENKATMPKEARQEMKNMHNDVEKVPYDEKDQDHANGQDSQLEELVKGNT